ncbi:HAD-IIA family hydrolase [Gryllotalpicola protaetiae]|uniref:HAD-IIA family hydrolase n=1 Tax=Gryllotalpicola protaetiae TaxID=2419771 RepID=A0A387BL24_9MICO|nr:HAD-IIA family hydrolase [Gryllotalpicola protaetiae]AYG04573.1 HAD-IIA family hydrolase [Gryllotalpicola protaetiae]
MALFRTRNSVQAAPLDGVDVLLADLDGVVYKGHEAIPHAVESINQAAQGARVGYITNNASRTDAAVAEQLRGFGLDTQPSDIVTSPQAAVRLLAGLVPAEARILVIGGEGLSSVVSAAGFTIVSSADDEPAAVIQGFAPELGWKDLAEASFALAGGDDGIPWVATNMDWTLPVARGIAPGNGTLVSAVHNAVGRLPVVAGKPEVAIFEEARARFGAKHPLFIGDRLDTDVIGANRAGIDSVLVLTGIDKAKQLLAAGPDSRPTYILEDLRGLHEAYPAVEKARGGATVVGDAAVRVSGTTVEVAREGGDPVNLLRAACHAIWDSGIAIYALDVPERLYR